MTVRVPIERDVLEWAISRTGSTADDLAKTNDLKRIGEWLNGDSQPTIRQAEVLAKKAGVPYPVLLLECPRKTQIDLPDFRTVKSQTLEQPSPELEQVIMRAELQLDWYIEYALEVAVPPLEIVGAATVSVDPEAAAAKMREILRWTPGKISYGDRAVAELAAAIEARGVLVTRSSVVGNNTSRPLNVDEFRGFTLIREGYSLIFVNTRDSKGAQMFSLGHELAHVVLGEPGVSAEDAGNARHRGGVEAWCNAFAAELLMPRAYVRESFEGQSVDHEAVAGVAHRLGVSVAALSYRLLDCKLISRSQAEEIIGKHHGHERMSKGGDGVRNIKSRVGDRLLTAIKESLGTELLNTRDALQLVGTPQPRTLDSLMKMVGEGP